MLIEKVLEKIIKNSISSRHKSWGKKGKLTNDECSLERLYYVSIILLALKYVTQVNKPKIKMLRVTKQK